LDRQLQGKSEAEQKLWHSAYSQVHEQNHFMKGEGPVPALERLRKQGLLSDLSNSDLLKEGHKMVKDQLGMHEGKKKNAFTIHDVVITNDKEKEVVGKIVENEKKREQANRLAPTDEQIKSALTPDIAEKLKKAGLNVNAATLKNDIIKRMEDDKGLNSADMANMKGFPVGAPYVAAGAVSGKQMDGLLAEQKKTREEKLQDKSFQALKESDPAEYKKQWIQQLKDTDIGKLLHKHAETEPKQYDVAKIDAADALIKKLQELQKGKS
jgi:hypothetical protein